MGLIFKLINAGVSRCPGVRASWRVPPSVGTPAAPYVRKAGRPTLPAVVRATREVPTPQEKALHAVAPHCTTTPAVPPQGGRTRRGSRAARARPAGADGAARGRLGPGWFAAVMGTGIVAVAAATLPRTLPGLREAATTVWAGAGLLLIVLAARYLGQRKLRVHAGDPLLAQFLGAPPMALLTVGAGTLLLGPRLIGERVALDADRVLWSAGTVLGLASACAVPYLMVTRHRFTPDAASGGWLLPVVPPIVSAATGALLVPGAPAGQPRLALLLGCYALLGLGLVAVLLVLAMVYSRLVHHEAPSGATVPTVWIGVGALDQVVTALGGLATAAPSALPAPYARGSAVAAVLGGLGIWGFAMLWLVLATALTVREIRRGLPFAPTWWSFIFPLGACVTGTSALATRTGSQPFVWCAVTLYALLVAAWAVVAWHSLRHAVGRRRRAGGPASHKGS
ncbi:TDT family transporter [Streptomyces sp. NPDC048281]|uniref:TDT family transporter n=1 Tax=Streptomyces sp. NPDC048281 TaxID=3154715 RepID=UPI0034496227